jgi:hypothetical protein
MPRFHAVGRSLHADHVLDLPPGPEGEGVMACRSVDGGVVHREGTDVNHAPARLTFIDRLGLQMQLTFVGVVLEKTFVGVVLEKSAKAFQGVDVDILAGRHLRLLRV